MSTEMTVSIYEHPGKLCQQKARELAEKLERFYFSAPSELRAEINRRAEEIRQRREVVSCPSGSMSQDAP
ncbi:MAG: hypothetical protein IJ060_10125 [Oscillospiraceae bacterium]|nr:hypothetical protein [Oscillospiraceae bacterium]